MMVGMRVIGVLRISVATDESTSISRQREAIDLWARLHGHTVVDWAIDEGVSGATSPFDRPGFGEWLTDEKATEYDGLIAMKLDRFGRSVSEFLRLADWLTERDKTISTTDNTIDTSTPQGRFFAVLLTALAQWEREIISDRVTDSHRKLRQLGRWAGGRTPYGFDVVDGEDGGKVLATNEAETEVRRKMVDYRILGHSYYMIADQLNAHHVPAPEGGLWLSTTVARILNSPLLIGECIHNGKVIRGDDGLPVKFCEPLITLSEWAMLEQIRESTSRDVSRRGEVYLLRGTMHCGSCGGPAYRQAAKGRSKTYEYLVCHSKIGNHECQAPFRVGMGLVEDQAMAVFMEIMGSVEVTERVFIPGEDYTAELERARRNIAYLREESEAGLWDDDRQGYMERQRSLKEREKTLKALPQRADSWEDRGTGVSYAVAWTSGTVHDRHRMLKDIELEGRVYKGEQPSATPKQGRTTMVAPLQIGLWLLLSWRANADTRHAQS